MKTALDISIWVHAGLALAGIVLWPVLFVLKKGTRFHVAYGKAMVGLGAVVLLAAAAIFFNPDYTQRLQHDIVHYGWRTNVHKVLFAWIWGYFFYFLCTGVRIWLRRRDGATLSRGPVDYALTAIGLGLGGAGTALSLVQALHPPLDWPRLGPMSVAMLVFAIFDLHSYRHPEMSFRTAYLAHGSRMYFGWWMLVMGPILRSPDWGGWLSFWSTAGILAGYVLLRWWALKQLGSSTTEAAPHPSGAS